MLLSARLKQETHDLHEWIEWKLDIGAPMSVQRYRAMLERWFGFFEPFEARPLPACADAWTGRAHRTKWLIDDLATLGLEGEKIASLPRCTLDALDLETPHVFGTLYVLEGSALGGRVIASRARAALGDAVGAFRFYDGHRDQTMPRWHRFKSALDALSPAFHDGAVDSARNTFTLLGHWLSGGNADPAGYPLATSPPSLTAS